MNRRKVGGCKLILKLGNMQLVSEKDGEDEDKDKEENEEEEEYGSGPDSPLLLRRTLS